jgi:hypothetical protein
MLEIPKDGGVGCGTERSITSNAKENKEKKIVNMS